MTRSVPDTRVEQHIAEIDQKIDDDIDHEEKKTRMRPALQDSRGAESHISGKPIPTGDVDTVSVTTTPPSSNQ